MTHVPCLTKSRLINRLAGAPKKWEVYLKDGGQVVNTISAPDFIRAAAVATKLGYRIEPGAKHHIRGVSTN